MSCDDELLNQLDDEERRRQYYANHPELQGLDVDPTELDYQQQRRRRSRVQNSTPREAIADIRDAMSTGMSDPNDPNLAEMRRELDRLEEVITQSEGKAAAEATASVVEKIDDIEIPDEVEPPRRRTSEDFEPYTPGPSNPQNLRADGEPRNPKQSAKEVLKKATVPMRSRMRAAGQGLAGIAAMAGYGALGGALGGTALGVVGNGVIDGLQGDDIRDGILDTAGTTATLAALGGGYGAGIGRMGRTRGGSASLTGAAVGGTLGLAVSAIKALASDQGTAEDINTLNAVAESEGLTAEQLVTGVAAAGLVPMALLPEGKPEVNTSFSNEKGGSNSSIAREARTRKPRPRRR